ncbi:succinylglutamate desuccinylase/aspartoacylase domain-containing protein [Psychromonas sp. MB-3u-54]|uniref:succinylglutamate desuccinylase/aspartoacylase domain-containing protein n=1 Tax=Psychromonas sp. MB-3u-54 TaxID=2058319 RepID=UPI003FA6CA4E
MPKGFMLASDRDVTYRVQQESGSLLFPSPKVKISFRAGLLLVKGNLSDIMLDSSS